MDTRAYQQESGCQEKEFGVWLHTEWNYKMKKEYRQLY